MKITVNGVSVPTVSATDGKLHIDVAVEGAGEDLPPVVIDVTGGTLNVHTKNVTRSGDISIHYFGAP